MEKQYDTTYVWRVFYMESGKIRESYFEVKLDAEQYVEWMKSKGFDAHLNHYQWEIKIEQ